MVLHPDGIARRIRWEGNDDGRPDWARVLDRVCALDDELRQAKRRKAPARLRRPALLAGLKAMAAPLRAIADNGAAIGLEPDLHQHLRPGIAALALQLDALG